MLSIAEKTPLLFRFLSFSPLLLFLLLLLNVDDPLVVLASPLASNGENVTSSCIDNIASSFSSILIASLKLVRARGEFESQLLLPLALFLPPLPRSESPFRFGLENRGEEDDQAIGANRGQWCQQASREKEIQGEAEAAT